MMIFPTVRTVISLRVLVSFVETKFHKRVGTLYPTGIQYPASVELGPEIYRFRWEQQTDVCVSRIKDRPGDDEIIAGSRSHSDGELPLRGASFARDLGSLARTRVVCHVPVSNLADNLVRALLHYCSTRAGVV